MNETTSAYTLVESHSILTKVLAIIGFCATVVLIIWLVVLGVKHVPNAFSSLAGIAESIQNYKPRSEITLNTEKDVVNSGESFTIVWDDVQQAGNYTLSYACTNGVRIETRTSDGALVAISCGETLSFPAPQKELTVGIISEKDRFSDATLKISFANKTGDVSLEDTLKMTVVNAAIPVTEVVVVPHIPEVPATAPEVPPTIVKTQTLVPLAPVILAPTIPVVTIMYPESNQNGFTDLAVTTTGVGQLKNGVFTYTAVFDTDRENALKFDIKNIGTKTSGTWEFTTILPNGQTYRSKIQKALKPLEHVEFTLGFYVDKKSKNDTVKITTKVSTQNDTNSKNDTSVWNVKVSK